MDFSKIKEGVLDFSSFLVSHVAWLALTLYSLWTALQPQLAEPISSALTHAFAALDRKDVASVVDGYGLKPLVPALVFFVGLFVLHAHRELLARAGKYVPPDLVMYWMPGLRSIEAGRWHYVLSQLPEMLSLRAMRSILESRYHKAVERRKPGNFLLSFNIFKSLAIMNLVLALLPSNPQRSISLLMFAAFSAASAVTAALHVYHAALVSLWAIDDVMRDLIAEQALEGKSASRQLSEVEVREIRDVVCAEKRVPVVTFGWNVPFVGSVRILKETVLRRNPKANA